jgi:hypothetical protein
LAASLISRSWPNASFRRSSGHALEAAHASHVPKEGLISLLLGNSASMDKDIAALNIEYYRRKLAEETDPSRRQIIMQLAAKEEEKLALIEANAATTKLN